MVRQRAVHHQGNYGASLWWTRCAPEATKQTSEQNKNISTRGKSSRVRKHAMGKEPRKEREAEVFQLAQLWYEHIDLTSDFLGILQIMLHCVYVE